MKRYYLNTLQFHTLPVVLKKKQNAMAKQIGMSAVSINRHLQDGDFKVNDILMLCNTYRIRLSYFVTTDEDPKLCSITVADEDEWKDITFSSKKLTRLIDNGTYTYTEICKKTEIVRSTLDTIMSGRCHIGQLLEFCNKMRCNVVGFINDNSLPSIVLGEDIRQQNDILINENKLLMKENEELKEKIKQLRNHIAELKACSNQLYVVAEEGMKANVK